MSSELTNRHKQFRALREELAERTYLTISEVADHYGVSESTIRKLPDELLPTVDLTPGSKRRTVRVRPDDAYTLWKRLRDYEEAKEKRAEDEYLAQLQERWDEREEREAMKLTEGVA